MWIGGSEGCSLSQTKKTVFSFHIRVEHICTGDWTLLFMFAQVLLSLPTSPHFPILGWRLVHRHHGTRLWSRGGKWFGLICFMVTRAQSATSKIFGCRKQTEMSNCRSNAKTSTNKNNTALSAPAPTQVTSNILQIFSHQKTTHQIKENK